MSLEIYDINFSGCKNCGCAALEGIELFFLEDGVTSFIQCNGCGKEGPKMATTIKHQLELLAEVWNKANETTETEGK